MNRAMIRSFSLAAVRVYCRFSASSYDRLVWVCAEALSYLGRAGTEFVGVLARFRADVRDRRLFIDAMRIDREPLGFTDEQIDAMRAEFLLYEIERQAKADHETTERGEQS